MKTALITGASRGIGKAIALRLAKNGYNIVLNYKQDDGAADSTQKEIYDLKANCLKVKCDVGRLSEVQKMHELVKKTFGGVDIIINNAGVARGGLIWETTAEDYDYIMDTNLRGTYNIIKVFSPHMISNKWGRIVNISSIWGQVGGANESIYSASKAGVIGFTKALAKEFAPSLITVNCIAPGAIKTDMLNLLPPSTLEWLKEEIPAGRLGEPSDVASLVQSLISDEAEYITGQIINISGGFTII